MKEKRGQVTLFVILAIIIVAAVLVFFLYVRPKMNSSVNVGLNFEKCVEDIIQESSERLGQTGGFIKPEFTYTYESQNIPYLCYTSEYYKTCTIQVPFLKQNFEKQMEIDTTQKVSACYENSLEELRAEGYSVSSGKLNYSVVVEPGVIRANIQSPTTVDSNKFSRFNVKINSPMYDLLMLSTTLLQFETKYGDTDVDTLMTNYPDYVVHKIKRDDGTTIYILESKVYGNKFQFASRSLAWPAGFDR